MGSRLGVLAPCKHCHRFLGIATDLKRIREKLPGGIVYRIVCTECGTKSDRKWTKREAVSNWNYLHTKKTIE